MLKAPRTEPNKPPRHRDPQLGPESAPEQRSQGALRAALIGLSGLDNQAGSTRASSTRCTAVAPTVASTARESAKVVAAIVCRLEAS
jgi:hypothetical protein